MPFDSAEEHRESIFAYAEKIFTTHLNSSNEEKLNALEYLQSFDTTRAFELIKNCFIHD